jgi:two-component system KDP operon response regulator KdpE
MRTRPRNRFGQRSNHLEKIVSLNLCQFLQSHSTGFPLNLKKPLYYRYQPHFFFLLPGIMKRKPTLLIADSDSKHNVLMRHILADGGFHVQAVRNGELAVEAAAREQPDLVMLEIALEGEIDGIVTARRIRDFSNVPIVFVAASGEPEDALRAFAAGADDYITKPVHAQLLLARIKAVLNRYDRNSAAPRQSEIVCGLLKIDIPARQVVIDGHEVYLSETEFNLILELAKNKGQVLLHEQLLTTVWGVKYAHEVDYLRSYVHILRRKLEVNPQHPKLIISKPGVGYMLAVEPAGD